MRRYVPELVAVRTNGWHLITQAGSAPSGVLQELKELFEIDYVFGAERGASPLAVPMKQLAPRSRSPSGLALSFTGVFSPKRSPECCTLLHSRRGHNRAEERAYTDARDHYHLLLSGRVVDWSEAPSSTLQ